MSNGSKAQRPQAQDDFAAGNEDGYIVIDVLANDRGDPDALWSVDQQDPTNQDYGQVLLPSGATLTSTGIHHHVVYKTNGAFDHLAAGETATDSFTYSIRLGDGTWSSATVEVLIHGINDPAQITPTWAILYEGDSADDLSTSGTIAIDDVDGPDSFIASIQQGHYGTFTIDEAGNWTYISDGAHDEFEDGGHYVDLFDYYAADLTMATIQINLMGKAEEPAMLNGFAASDLVAFA